MQNRGMIYGYARVSTNGQDLAQQLAQLEAAGCTKIYREKISGASAERPQLKRAIGALDPGDVLMVTATDRFARNTRDLLNILHAVKEAGAGFRSIAEPMVDTTSQFADVIIAVLGSWPVGSGNGSPSAPPPAGFRPRPVGSSSAGARPSPLTSRPRRYSGSRLATHSAPSRPCSMSTRRRYRACIEAAPNGSNWE